MKKIISLSLVLMLLVSAGGLLVHAATQSTAQIKVSQPQPTLGRFNITFNIYEGEGCACVPLQGVSIEGYALNGDDQVEALTDEEGLAIIAMEYGLTYRMTISVEDYETVLFDFDIIDEQTFSFHMQEEEEAVSPVFAFLQTVNQWYRARVQQL